MKEKKERKRKLILVSVTFALCLVIMLSGTFAWSSISQTVINETMGEMLNPGGRLHDDFNGSNKDIYVENFTAGVDSMDIIVRIRLSEYMEIGPDAGINREASNRNVTILTKHDTDGDEIDDADADIETPSTWDIVSPRNDNHYGYWSWGLGGQTVYLPTLDTNTQSNSVDRNGTYEGADDDMNAGTPFDDYFTYVEGNMYGTRTAKATIDGTVMNMEYWLTEGGMKLGNYWVYDGDGWAYWANPLSAQEATGLLLDKISHSRTIEDKWYYAINVECQMVTVDEIGTAANEKGFYSEEAMTPPSSSARLLLDEMIDEIGYIEIDSGTEGMLTADISEEELEALLNQKDAEKETVKDMEEEKENLDESEHENSPDVIEGEEQNPDGETNQDGNPPDGTEEGSGEDAENEQKPGEGENTTPETSPEDTNTENGTGNDTTGSTPNGDSTVEGGIGQDTTPTNPEDSGNANPDNTVTETDTPTDTTEGTGTSENGDTTPQEPGTETTGISEESGDVLVHQNTSQLF